LICRGFNFYVDLVATAPDAWQAVPHIFQVWYWSTDGTAIQVAGTFCKIM
jgi:hypothetical protein